MGMSDRRFLVCERELALVNTLFVPRFRRSVGTLVTHGKGGIPSLHQDGVDDRLRSWGVDPPEEYAYAGTVDGVHRDEGSLGVP